MSFNRITQWNQYAYTHIGNTILHHPLKNRMVSGNSMLNTGLKTSRQEFPASQKAAFSKWGTRDPRVLVQSWVKQRQGQKTGDYGPTGFGGLTTPPKGCHSVKKQRSFSATLIRGRGGYTNQPTNKQAGRGDARLQPGRSGGRGRGIFGVPGQPGLHGEFQGWQGDLFGEERTKPKPRLPQRTDGPSLPSVFLEAGGELQPPGSPQCPPHLPRAAGQGLWRRPAGRTADSGEASSSAHCQGRREERGGVRATRLPRTPAPGANPANVSPSAPTMAGQHPRANTGPAGRDFSGETAAARVLSPPAERRPANTDSHGRRGPKPVLSSAT